MFFWHNYKPIMIVDLFVITKLNRYVPRKTDIIKIDLNLPSLPMEYFHSLEVVDRVSETQLQVGENYLVKICLMKNAYYK